MKNMMKISALLMAMLLLFAGCGKEQNEPPVEPIDPPVTQAPTTEPATEVPTEPATEARPSEDDQASYEEEHAYWMDTMSYIIEDDYTIVDVQLLETDENNTQHYAVWLSQIQQPGVRTLSRRHITLTPDGKDHQVTMEEDKDFNAACQAIMNYRMVEQDLMKDVHSILEGLGYTLPEPTNTTSPYPTQIPYEEFLEAMEGIMSPELYERRFGQFFTEKDGLLYYGSTGGSGVPYIVDDIHLQQDGSYLVNIHGFYPPGGLDDRMGLATLQTLPDGRYVVTSWADNTGLNGVDKLKIQMDGSYTVTPWGMAE